jgi:hypothetical protein
VVGKAGRLGAQRGSRQRHLERHLVKANWSQAKTSIRRRLALVQTWDEAAVYNAGGAETLDLQEEQKPCATGSSERFGSRCENPRCHADARPRISWGTCRCLCMSMDKDRRSDR